MHITQDIFVSNMGVDILYTRYCRGGWLLCFFCDEKLLVSCT